MATTKTSKTATGPRQPGTEAARSSAPEFPGCTPVHLPADELDRSDQRLEYWDGATETAWICEPTSPYHERPSGRLTRLTERIAAVRGAPIESYGSMDLRQHDGPRSIMQADESVYLHPGSARLPGPSAMVIGVDDYPDVVLEVDHTTDVRRGKLALYESWGFPEVWVEVPDETAPSRPRGRRPGLTIHLLEAGAYRAAPESRAFPGWTAEEIHEALNEPGAVWRRPARCWSGLGRRSASGRAPGRITIRCCGRSGAGDTSAAWRRNARCCAGRRRGSSTTTRRNGWQRSWSRPPMRTAWRKPASGSSSAKAEPSSSTGYQGKGRPPY